MERPRLVVLAVLLLVLELLLEPLLLLLRGRDGANVAGRGRKMKPLQKLQKHWSRVSSRSGCRCRRSLLYLRDGRGDLGDARCCPRRAVRTKQSKINSGLVGSVSRGYGPACAPCLGRVVSPVKKPARFALASTDGRSGRC